MCEVHCEYQNDGTCNGITFVGPVKANLKINLCDNPTEACVSWSGVNYTCSLGDVLCGGEDGYCASSVSECKFNFLDT